MGKLLEQIEATPVNLGGKHSTVDLALQELQGEDRADLLCVLRNPTISPTVLSQVLANNNIEVSRTAIIRWRNREGI